MLPGLFDGKADWADVALAVGVTFAVAYGIAALSARLVRALFHSLTGADSAEVASLPSVRRPLRIVRAAIFLLSFAALTLPALRLAGVDVRMGIDPDALGVWVLSAGLRVGLIVVAAYVLVRVTGVVVQRFEFELSRGSGLDVVERGKRARTLGGLIRNVVVALVVGLSVLMILRELRVDIMPVLTGAGIAGLAVGFGAQTLVKDIIAGFFLILENQVRVGDVAVINGTGGSVEQITLRTIVLRDIEGAVHVFPNGSVQTLANRSRDFAYAVLELGVDYGEDTDRAVDVLRQAGETLLQDPRWRPHILESLEVLGIEGFDSTSVTLKVRMKTVPLKQWDVGRELRRRVKKQFDGAGIASPVRQVTVHMGRRELDALTGLASASEHRRP